jgi:serine/threonine protein kinase
MNTKRIENLCPKCGEAIPGDAPEGLCPRCVLAGAAASADTGRMPDVRITPPSLEVVAAAFPQLEIIELMGIGGMGVVYKARQPKLDRLVALKLLPLSLGADPAFAERFEREARFLARLNHPSIVSIFEFGQSGGFCFLLLEYVDGVNLRQAMQAGRFSQAEALAIVPAICVALQYAHENGVMHRDIKPENILLDARGAVKLADFGIAKLAYEPGGGRAEATLTQSGARLGTPNYMAPEQIETPSDVDHRADIYSLGVVFYELLTGELPIGRFAPPSEKANLDARVDAIVLRALAKERELRQQSAGEVKTQVEGLGSTAKNTPTTPAAETQKPRPGERLANPWPHRLFWLLLALGVLPAAAVIAALLAPILQRASPGPGAGFLAGLVPIVAGALLVAGFMQTRPKLGDAKSPTPWNPWPKRVFWAVILFVVTPGLVLALALMIPWILAPSRPSPASPTVVSPQSDTSHPNGDVGGLPQQLPSGNPGAAALKWHLAWAELGRKRQLATAGVIAPDSLEVLAAERDLAVAGAEFLGRPSDAAAANVNFAKSRLEITQRNFSLSLVGQDEVNAATLALAVAEEALQKTLLAMSAKGSPPSP